MCRREDFDVKLVTPTDFKVPDLSASLFTANSSLCLILSDIHNLGLSRRAISDHEMASILGSFRSWLDSLPSDLRLYDQDAGRPYDLLVLQLHILYLSSIIALLLLPGKHRNSRAWSTVSFVAAGCVARLYEDVDCHEEVQRLLPHHGWLITVAAIPLIYSAANFPTEASASAHDLDVLISVVSKLTEKHASAKLVLRKITAFRTKVESHPVMASSDTDQQHILDASRPPQVEREKEILEDARSLLPFPDCHCQSMRFLGSGADGYQDPRPFDAMPFEFDTMDHHMDWSILFDEFATEANGIDTISQPLDLAALLRTSDAAASM